MQIDKTTRAISGLVIEDIGQSFDDVIITCRHILFQQQGKPFQAFVCDGGISCSVNSSLTVSEGLSYKVSGKITEFRGQPQLAVKKIELIQSDDFDHNVRVNFLAGFFENFGITKRMADKISKTYGNDFMDKLANSPQEVALSIRGLAEAKAVSIGEELVINNKAYKRYYELMSIGLSCKQAKYCSSRSDISPDDIRRNPYCLAVFDSFSFEDCEVIAAGKDVEPLDKHRVFSAVKSNLERILTSSSSTYVVPSELEKSVKNSVVPKGSGRSIVTSFQSAFELACDYGVKEGILSIYRFENNKCIGCKILDNDARVTLSRYFKAEAQIKKELEKFTKARFVKPSKKSLDNTISELSQVFNIELDSKQYEAVSQCMYRPLTVITGGPGTGKTTIMGLLSAHFENKRIECVYAAPTGRAAKRLSEVTGREAYTLHRILEAVADPDSPNGFFFRRNKSNPIKARVIVIDEMSMVDTILFREFLMAVDKGTSLILIGDPDQLPSVGSGNVLSDILTSVTIPNISLNTIHRQSEDGDIPSNASRILSGEDPVPGEDFRIINCGSEDEALNTLCEIYEEKISLEDSDVIVLSPTKQSQIGLSTVNINTILQLRAHSVEEAADITSSGIGRFLEGDRIMQIKNNYAIEYFDPESCSTGEGIFNGEIGTVTEIDRDAQAVTVTFEDGKIVRYESKDIDNIELAYAVTVHKSQGCEFNDCIIVLGKMNNLLIRRNILYTAVTRGKRSVTIINTENTLERFLKAPVINTRNTSLKDFIAIIDSKANATDNSGDRPDASL